MALRELSRRLPTPLPPSCISLPTPRACCFCLPSAALPAAPGGERRAHRVHRSVGILIVILLLLITHLAWVLCSTGTSQAPWVVVGFVAFARCFVPCGIFYVRRCTAIRPFALFLVFPEVFRKPLELFALAAWGRRRGRHAAIGSSRTSPKFPRNVFIFWRSDEHAPSCMQSDSFVVHQRGTAHSGYCVVRCTQ